MKKLIIKLALPFALAFYSTCFINAQTIKWSNGLSVSSLQMDSRNKILDENISRFTTFLGLDYFDKKYFSMSSEVGLITLGGNEKDTQLNLESLKKPEEWLYLQVNTTFRAKALINDKTYGYAGIGPRINFLTENGSFKDSFFDDTYKMKKIDFGAKIEVGINHSLNENYIIGFNINYMPSFSKSGISPLGTIYNKDFTFCISLGYKL
jgi:hypothetical protein